MANNYDNLYDCTVVDQDHNKIGGVGQVYLDDQTGLPTWITIKTGLFGTKETFVPLEQAVITEETIQVPYAESFVRDAPRVDPDGHLDADEESQLYQYYGIAAVPADRGTAEPMSAEPELPVADTTSVPSADAALSGVVDDSYLGQASGTENQTLVASDPAVTNAHLAQESIGAEETPFPAVSPETDHRVVQTSQPSAVSADQVAPVETEAPAATPIPGDKNADGKLSFSERVSMKWDEMNHRGHVDPAVTDVDPAAAPSDPYDRVVDDPQAQR